MAKLRYDVGDDSSRLTVTVTDGRLDGSCWGTTMLLASCFYESRQAKETFYWSPWVVVLSSSDCGCTALLEYDFSLLARQHDRAMAERSSQCGCASPCR